MEIYKGVNRKIRLLAHDSKIPNYAIMKISSYHKAKGDDVAWYEPILDMDTDILYISKIFTFSDDPTLTIPMPPKAQIIKGGTGYDIKSQLPPEIEAITNLDYSLYPDCDYSIIFTTRGCIRNCAFCVVREKEGIIHDVDMAQLNPNGKYIRVQDNNFFASKTWRERLEKLKAFNQPIDFNGGLDLRIMTEEMCQALKSCKIKSVKVAFDDYKDKDVIMPKLEMLCKWINPNKIIVYVLVGNKENHLLDEDIERVNLIWGKCKAYPFIMPYVDYNDNKREIPRDIKDFARWCNNRFIFKSSTWEEYKQNYKKEK